MNEYPDTSESLIAQVRNPSNQEAWERFEQIYRPVIFRIARLRGMQHSDALDLVQQVLLSVSAAIGDYEARADGPPFRHWLSRITKNAILKALSRKSQVQAGGGSEVLNALQSVPTDQNEVENLIETEYQREIYVKAAAIVRREVEEPTWVAFEMTVLQSASIPHASEVLRMPIGSVYAARSRVIRKLRDAVERIEGSTAFSSDSNS